MRITAEFKDLDEFLAFVHDKGADVPVVKAEAPAEPVTAEPEAIAEPETVTEPETAVETAPDMETRAYSLAEIQKAGAQLLATNPALRAPVTELFKAYGIKSLPELIPANYAAFADELKRLGAEL